MARNTLVLLIALSTACDPASELVVGRDASDGLKELATPDPDAGDSDGMAEGELARLVRADVAVAWVTPYALMIDAPSGMALSGPRGSADVLPEELRSCTTPARLDDVAWVSDSCGERWAYQVALDDCPSGPDGERIQGLLTFSTANLGRLPEDAPSAKVRTVAEWDQRNLRNFGGFTRFALDSHTRDGTELQACGSNQGVVDDYDTSVRYRATFADGDVSAGEFVGNSLVSRIGSWRSGTVMAERAEGADMTEIRAQDLYSEHAIPTRGVYKVAAEVEHALTFSPGSIHGAVDIDGHEAFLPRL